MASVAEWFSSVDILLISQGVTSNQSTNSLSLSNFTTLQMLLLKDMEQLPISVSLMLMVTYTAAWLWGSLA